ncbi:MAG TPA: mechanosensitive ion channel family protein, partial [Longimicrobiaceae bacterium]|nr:mechanosensitive ion channel family protein [Longimicrobiaceae bacterium]
DTTAQELARSRAKEVEKTVHGLRAQGTLGFWLRLLLQIVLVVGGAVLAHLGLRALKRRAPRRPHTSLGRALLAWAASLAQFILWVLVAVAVLWLIPATSSITFELWHRWLAAVGSAVDWLQDNGLGIAFILVVAYFGARIVGAVVRQSVLTFGARQGGRTQLRASTLAGTLGAASQFFVLFLALVALFAFLDVNPVPLLASAGVAGIALGFGVQSLIRDFFSGIFILLEDQYGVGDVIRVNDVSGTVERFTLRITQLRSLDGSFTSIPNGEITRVTNLTKDWSQAVLDVNIALGESVDRAVEVIQQAAAELTADWKERIRGEPQVLGVETVDPAAQAITIRVVVRTAPLERAAVSRELRRRILDAFLEAKIQVPPRAVVTLPGQNPPQ